MKIPIRRKACLTAVALIGFVYILISAEKVTAWISKYGSYNTEVDKLKADWKTKAATLLVKETLNQVLEEQTSKSPVNNTEDAQLSEEYKSETETLPQENYDGGREMRRRAEQVQTQCRSQLSRGHDQNEKERAIFLISKKSTDFLYKPIPKIGWTTWIYLLFEHGGLLSKVGHQIGRTKWQWGWGTPYQEVGFSRLEGAKMLKHVTVYKERFVIVRNPWDRLVSGYKNKALEGKFAYIFKRPCEWLKRGMPPLTFKQFVTCMLDRSKGPGTPLSSSTAALQINEHWMPLYTIAVPCIANYTLIADFEHFNNDTAEALKILNLKATLTHRNPTKQTKSLSDWYDELDWNMIEDLKELYKYDFQIFGYDPTPPNLNSNKTKAYFAAQSP